MKNYEKLLIWLVVLISMTGFVSGQYHLQSDTIWSENFIGKKYSWFDYSWYGQGSPNAIIKNNGNNIYVTLPDDGYDDGITTVLKITENKEAGVPMSSHLHKSEKCYGWTFDITDNQKLYTIQHYSTDSYNRIIERWYIIYKADYYGEFKSYREIRQPYLENILQYSNKINIWTPSLIRHSFDIKFKNEDTLIIYYRLTLYKNRVNGDWVNREDEEVLVCEYDIKSSSVTKCINKIWERDTIALINLYKNISFQTINGVTTFKNDLDSIKFKPININSSEGYKFIEDYIVFSYQGKIEIYSINNLQLIKTIYHNSPTPIATNIYITKNDEIFYNFFHDVYRHTHIHSSLDETYFVYPDIGQLLYCWDNRFLVRKFAYVTGFNAKANIYFSMYRINEITSVTEILINQQFQVSKYYDYLGEEIQDIKDYSGIYLKITNNKVEKLWK